MTNESAATVAAAAFKSSDVTANSFRSHYLRRSVSCSMEDQMFYELKGLCIGTHTYSLILKKTLKIIFILYTSLLIRLSYWPLNNLIQD